MSRTSNFSKNHPYAVARGWVGPGYAANSLDSISDGTTEVDDVRAILVTGGKVNDLDNGLAEITFGGLSVSSNSGAGQGGALPVYMLNNSTRDLIVGDVVIVDSTKDSAVTTTSTPSNTAIVGVVQAPIQKLYYGPVLFNGLAPVVNTTGTITRGGYALTSASAALAAQTAARVAGSFGVYLTGTDAPDFVTASATTTTSAPVTSISLNMPAGIVAGRVLFAGLWLDSTTSAVTMTGWTRIGSTAGYYYFYKISEGGDTAVPSWTGASSATAAVLLLSANASVAATIETQAFDSTTSAASVSGLSDAPRYAIAGVAANVAAPGSGFSLLANGAANYTTSGGAPTLVQSKEGDKSGVTFDSAVTPGNVVVAITSKLNDNDTWVVDTRQTTLCAQTTDFVHMARQVQTNPPGPVPDNSISIEAKVSADNYAGPYKTAGACDSGLSRMVLMELNHLSTSGYQVATHNAGVGSPVNLGTFTVGANDVTIMAIVWETAATDPQVNVNGFTQIQDGTPPSGFYWWWVGYKVGNGDASVTLSNPAGQKWGAAAIVLTGGTVSNTAGTLAGKYIGHASSATSPFTGASQQNDAIFAVNLLHDAKPSALLYGPDLGAGGSSISVGSNSTDVAGITAMGATGAYADAAHWHKGVVAVTSSSSNTLQRPIVNLRPGTGIAFADTDTDGDGAFDTLTIVNTGVPGPAGPGGSASIPGWVSQFVGTSDSTHYYWTGSDLAGFTSQTVTGSATWSEGRNLISALFSNQTVDDAAVQLIAKTISTGDAWELAINTTVLRNDSANSTANYRAIGIVFADGTTTTSNCVIGHLQADNGGGGSTVVLVGRHGTLTNINTGAPWVSQDIARTFGDWIWVKLKYSASNTFQLSFANVDRNQYTSFGEADISKTMTPSYVGLFVSMQNAGTALGTFGPLLKV